MVKERKGSRRGRTKLTKAGKRRAKRHAHVNTGRVTAGAVQAPGAVRDNWDAKLTRNQNLRRLGLAADVNSIQKSGAARKVPTAVVEALSAVAGRGEAKAPPRAPPGQVDFVRRAVAKHGEDYDAMARDIALNYLQWTPRQLRGKVAKVAALGLVELPQ